MLGEVYTPGVLQQGHYLCWGAGEAWTEQNRGKEEPTAVASITCLSRVVSLGAELPLGSALRPSGDNVSLSDALSPH